MAVPFAFPARQKPNPIAHNLLVSIELGARSIAVQGTVDLPSGTANAATNQEWAAYNGAMAAPFAERNPCPVDSLERDAVAQKIMTLLPSEPEA